MKSDRAARLRWCQPELLTGYHELRRGDDRVLSTLRFEPKAAVRWVYADRRSALAKAEWGEWQFSVERKGLSGFIGLGATVPITGTDSGEVKVRAFFLVGKLHLANGRQFQWRGGAARSSSAFLANNGEILLRFDPGSFFDRVNTYVEIQPEALKVREHQLLIALGLYLRLAIGKVWR
jgi:hypothetical protein